ncbi:hypothetical protein KC343_g771 [Hortaea werneckii]|uniref:3'-5' exonuclease domain-containing protein n=1 Tax=Hortaea werneckii TaxID=91943 RepID=A0A3M7HJB2_HORWE|nr:hypothetical protein KC365_g13781 [Hortaea werneckii]KAI7287103.1 hypothetical protein KC352_g4747 [Hortaea werneckii]KAI7572423.1 hypothetical protein KC317_g774 [Hortaea werneckii]KAI7627489.1 hypothetical protein KC346_g721 [Hortaea werneckii]KAI7637348.1 hypothetical protein KC343_g771 [Hortaea werneckii]
MASYSASDYEALRQELEAARQGQRDAEEQQRLAEEEREKARELTRQTTFDEYMEASSPRLVDVTGLGKLAFHTAGPDGKTLKHILESQEIVKVFFAIRNDSDALFGLFGIRVQGIEDIQLMELASRGFQKRHVNGLAKCIERDSALPFAVRREFRASKERGHKLFDPNLGGGYAVFDERPLSAEIQKYCVQDVMHMPALGELYRAKLCDVWWRKVEAETLARIELSQGRTFNGQGMHMAKAPVGWEHFRPSLAEKQSRVLLIQRRDSAATAPALQTLPTSIPPGAAAAAARAAVELSRWYETSSRL